VGRVHGRIILAIAQSVACTHSPASFLLGGHWGLSDVFCLPVILSHLAVFSLKHWLLKVIIREVSMNIQTLPNAYSKATFYRCLFLLP